MQFTRNIQRTKDTVTIIGLVMCLCVMAPEICTALDVYVVYSGKDNKKKEIFLSGLSKEFSAKSFNVDRLRGGDYSQKQKALAKFKNASVVVFLFDEPMKALGRSTLSSDLIIVKSLLTGVMSETRTLYVFSQDMDSTQLEQELKSLHRTAEVVRVKEKTLDLMVAASLLTAKILKPK